MLKFAETKAKHPHDDLVMDITRELPDDEELFILEDLFKIFGDRPSDTPVLSIAGIGIKIGSLGSKTTIEAVEIILIDVNPSKIEMAVTFVLKPLRIACKNIAVLLGARLF